MISNPEDIIENQLVTVTINGKKFEGNPTETILDISETYTFESDVQLGDMINPMFFHITDYDCLSGIYDCAGECDGDAALDECGVCEGDNLSCSQNYDYELKDINPTSPTYGIDISPGYFQGQVTLHYFGHQT